MAASLGLARWIKPVGLAPAEANHVVRAADPQIESLIRSTPPVRPGDSALDARCHEMAEKLRERLGPDCQVEEFPPFVLAGDLSADELKSWHAQTIGPASRAMAHSFFRIAPDEPITVLLFANEHSYDHYAHELFGDGQISIYGYYKRGQRVLVMNAATGAGTVVHELTHALADFDCPRIPDWFNEGLASLHEQCRIREDESGIDGLENWRLPILQKAIQEKRLRSLESLITGDDFRLHNIGLNYAQARYFCLWLQRQGLLKEFFHRWRATQGSDPLGAEAVQATLTGRDWNAIDREFQNWVMTLEWQPSTATTAALATP